MTAVLSPEMIAVHAAEGGRSGVLGPRDTLRLGNDEPASDPRGSILGGTPGVALRHGSNAARATGTRRARWSLRRRRAAEPPDQRKRIGRAAFAATPLPEQGSHLRRWSEKSARGALPLPLPRRLRQGERGSTRMLFSSYRPLSGIVIMLSNPIVIRIAKTFRKTYK